MRLGFAVLALLGSMLLAADPPQSVRSSLGGRWRLLPAESEDALAKLQAAMPRQRGGGLSGEAGREPLGGRHGGFPGRVPYGRRGDAPGVPRGVLMLEFLEPIAELSIVQRADEILVQDANENTVVLRPDGRKWRRAGGAVQTRSRWRDDDLVCESSADNLRLTTTYRLPMPDRLEVQQRLRLPFGAEAGVKRVYERVIEPASRASGDRP